MDHFTPIINYNKRNNINKVAVDYKGKHFIITDENMLEDLDIINVYVDVETIIKNSLVLHVMDCIYYGIPAYIGKDEKLRKKIDEIYKKYKS